MPLKQVVVYMQFWHFKIL